MMYLSEFILYCCFAIVVGNQILVFIPEGHRPSIDVPYWILNSTIIGIAVLSFSSLLTIVNSFAEDFDNDYWMIFRSVLFEFNIGHAWLITLGLTALLLFIQSFKRAVNTPSLEFVTAALTLALILAFAWASHCTASYQLKGFVPHAIHFLSVCIWIGTLFIVSWFSTNHNNWSSFLKWFSPLALVCLVFTISAGFFLMNLLVPDYVNSWIVSYGQALLFKHLLIIPLLTFAFMNGVLVKRKLKQDSDFNPIPMVRTESIIALLVFGAMAVMGQQSPTENLAAVIQFDKPSKLFLRFYDGTITRDSTIQWISNGNSIFLGMVSLLLLLSAVLLFHKKSNTSGLAVLFGISFVGSAYTAIMMGVR
ncbi:copper resistance D family protein [Paenibacillus typhae]|uniref:Putative copper resistance protein D n=1 Tax=Paenibacillus typhae TaxID=1174501 RepID=A0A1G8GKB7_9BACL|nr:CopD family protein [Paenibacillus typhae]SDH94756.1 putative copper resistance protein D [Paenibacillus typhae]